MERRLLTNEEIAAVSAAVPGWAVTGGKLTREFRFADFTRAFGFMASVATVAEKLDHHPDWSNVYNRVEIHLWTHDLGGISTLDVELARRINTLAGELRSALPN